MKILTGHDRIIVSNHVLKMIRNAADRGVANQILIVPEQFSHEAERRLCEVGGVSISRWAEVLSFSRLADRAASRLGGVANMYLDKGGQLLTMALAAEMVVSKIKLYASAIRRPEFLLDMIRLVEELQTYGVALHGCNALKTVAEKVDGQLAEKLEELGLLYEAYMACCEVGVADPTSRLFDLADSLEEICDAITETQDLDETSAPQNKIEWLRAKKIYIDGFSDFTGAELRVIEMLMRTCELCITLPSEESGSAITRATRKALVKQAECYNVPVEEVCIPGFADREYGVQYVLDHLFGAEKAVPIASKALELCAFASVEEECRGAALRIRRLLSDGARCRDISVACTDPAVYEAPLRAAFRMAELPAYFAGETDLLADPVLGGVLYALDAAVGPLDREDVILYLKSGLAELDQDTSDRLDSYAYLWNIHGSQWERDWEFHPRGYGETWTEEDRAYLETLNQDRERSMDPLRKLRRGFAQAKNTGEMVLVLDAFLESVNLRRHLEDRANSLEQEGEGQRAQALLQVYEILRRSLEQMWLTVGSTVRTPDDFVRVYRLLLTQYRVGTIPAGLDEIHVSDLPDLRMRRTRHLLILGAADGKFPSYQPGESLLTEEERRVIMDVSDLRLAPERGDRMEQEMGRIYAAMYASEKSLYLSYAGEQPSFLFRRISALCPSSMVQPQESVFLDLPSIAAWRLRNGVELSSGVSELDRIEMQLKCLRSYAFSPLKESTVQGMYGRQLYLSASRIDKFASCRFAFFLAYGLKAQPRRQAKLDPSVFGTFVHAVLENTVLRVNQEGGFRTIEQGRLIQIAMQEIDAYATLHFPEQAERAAYLFRRSKEEVLGIVMDLGEELRASLFQPVCCELEFSQSGTGLPPIEIRGKYAVSQISGFVDRVDLYEVNGKTYVRVVDYKTGQKDFDYTDILNGAGLQILVYLFALRQYGGAYFMREHLEPAGVLYLPARKQYTLTHAGADDSEIESDHREERRRKGLLLDDENLLAAMEENPDAPRFMPYKVDRGTRKGDLASYRQMILMERHVLRTLAQMTDDIARGDVKPDPVSRGQFSSCTFCDYATICHGDLCERNVRVMAATPAAKFWEKLEEEEAKHG